MDAMADDTLNRIEQKVFSGERITFDEGVFLDERADLLTLGRMANHIRERKNGNFAYYNTNVHLNPTNVCVYRCRFCAFRADLRAEKAYVFTDDMIRERVLEARSNGATEIHVVGGLHHQKKFDWYLNIVRVLHETCPEIHIKAWTAVEIGWFSFITKQPVEWVLKQLVDGGSGQYARWWSRDLPSGNSRSTLRAQSRCDELDRGPSCCASGRVALKCDDALRAS